MTSDDLEGTESSQRRLTTVHCFDGDSVSREASIRFPIEHFICGNTSCPSVNPEQFVRVTCYIISGLWYACLGRVLDNVEYIYQKL